MNTETTVETDPPYLQDLHQRERTSRASQMRRDRWHEQLEEVNKASLLDRRASVLEGLVSSYDTPESGTRERIQTSRESMVLLLLAVLVVLLMFITDFLVGTPDLANEAATKAYSSLVSIAPTFAGAQQSQETSPETLSPPPWLRMTVGAAIVFVFILVTLSWKKICCTRSCRENIAGLRPGEDERYKKLRAEIATKRVMKALYLVALLGCFAFLYHYDLERASKIEELEQLTQAEQEWAEVNAAFSIRDVLAGENSSREPEIDSTTKNETKTPIARHALAVYSLLYLLHLVLVLLPSPPKTEDRGLAFFSRSAALRKAGRLREQEEPLLRSIGERIQQAPQSEREDLNRVAFSVVSRLNAVVGWEAVRPPHNSGNTPQEDPQYEEVHNDPNSSDDSPAPSGAIPIEPQDSGPNGSDPDREILPGNRG